MDNPDTPRPGDLIPVKEPRSAPWSPGREHGHLPHLECPGCTYFVTFCLHGVRRRGQGPKIAESPEAIASSSEPHSTSTQALLNHPEAAALIQSSMLHFHGSRYLLHAWVVMPDHVHCVLTPLNDHGLQGILHSWKSYTANQINRKHQRSGAVWESSYFDHLVRSDEHLQRFVRYVETNPVAADLCEVPEDWPYSSASYCTHVKPGDNDPRLV